MMFEDTEDFLYSPITKEAFEGLRAEEAKARRICFQTTHSREPKRSEHPYIGTFNIPFLNTIKEVYDAGCGLGLIPNQNPQGGYWRSIQNENEFQRIKAWVDHQGSRVFLRDCLDMSLALGMNIALEEGAPPAHTELGDLESRAKNSADPAAIAALEDRFAATIAELPRYRDAKLIAAIPPSPGKTYDFPSVLVGRLAERLGLQDITSRFQFAEPKGSVKSTKLEDKWETWAKAGLAFSPRLMNRPSVILVDDKYQSGCSAHFVASVLREAGAGCIFGIYAVKTLRDSDNDHS
jgi:hypothetical protein